ncbi:Signal transduction histidine-protein kinase/phosphatase DegS [Tepidimonas thermarum]|uniref:histidine kinase n=1 Tax=Tepidimonas thermarum TaxID=335431 RepID=A0A554WYQ4_9BURK|nr:ATP-binding protein [Tepidimonas thermarum]TSE28707.1 Signal transduction histidine-protein kinase/phosphatase DegS [Tepidimonas thermarum]
MNTLRLLHLEDNPVDHGLLVRALRRGEVEAEVVLVDTLEAFEAALSPGQPPFDAVLADYHLGGFSGLQAWEWLRASGLELPFILVSGAIGEATVADAMVRGVSDYVDKSQLSRLPRVLQRALELAATRRAQADAARELAASRQRLLELTEHLQTSIDRERADIAREIHDDIGGALAAVKLDLAWLARRLTDEEALRHVQSALGMAEQALGASQRIMRNLRPAVLDQGLMAALQWLTRTFAERTGLEVVLRGRLQATLAPRLEMVAYRTVQEALTNVLKHAGARRVTIDVSDLEGHLTVEIADDGRGASAQELGKERSFGLLGLRERAQSVGGWLDVVTAPGQGMTLILSVPLTASAVLHEAEEDDR